jgi:hypothetical protein
VSEPDDPRVIDGRLCWPCPWCRVTWIPLQGPDRCLACQMEAERRAIHHPSQWHPYGPLADHHDRARLAHLTAGQAGLETP